jgi:hypothetical protein
MGKSADGKKVWWERKSGVYFRHMKFEMYIW